MRVLIFLTVVLLHACSPFGWLHAVTPTRDITRSADIVYAQGSRHTLDVYAPAHATAPLPVIVFFYGGGWETGDKGMYRFLGTTLAAQGVVVAIPDYRLYPQVQFPAFVQDAAAAVAWLHAHAGRYGGDPRRLFLMGHSAGAQIATLLALDPSYLHAVALSPRHDLCGVIGLAGPYDFLPFNRAQQAIFGPRAEWGRTQPINYVTGTAPPMLLLAGRADGTVDPDNTVRLAAKLRSAGVSVHSTLYPGITHTGIIASVSQPLSFIAPTRSAILRFVRSGGACSGH